MTIEAMDLTSNTLVLEIHEEDMREEEITSEELDTVKYLQQELGTTLHSLSVEISEDSLSTESKKDQTKS